MKTTKLIECKDCKLSFWLLSKDGKTQIFCCRKINSESFVYDEFKKKTIILSIIPVNGTGCYDGKLKFHKKILFWRH